MELEPATQPCPDKLNSAIATSAGITGTVPTLQRVRSRSFQFSMKIYVLATMVASESSPDHWLVARLFSLAKKWFPYLSKGASQGSQGENFPLATTASESATDPAWAAPKTNENFRNAWLPPEPCASFKRRRLLWMSHRGEKYW